MTPTPVVMRLSWIVHFLALPRNAMIFVSEKIMRIIRNERRQYRYDKQRVICPLNFTQ